MRNIFYLFGLLMLFSVSNVSGQDSAEALKAARELSAVVKSGDWMWMVEKLDPRIRKTTAMQLKGGDAELVEKVRKLNSEFKKRGVICESFEVFEPFGEHMVRAGSEKIVILPTRLVISQKSPEGEGKIFIEKISFLYATAKVSAPKKWYFIDGASYNINRMRNFFYDLPLNTPLPPISERKMNKIR